MDGLWVCYTGCLGRIGLQELLLRIASERKSTGLMITFFTTAKSVKGHDGVIQRNALESCTLMHPDVEVILFGAIFLAKRRDLPGMTTCAT